jgi:hypothetical protein
VQCRMFDARWTRNATHTVVVAAGLVCLFLANGAMAANGYDGVYRGDVTRTMGDSSICGRATYQTSFTIVNGQFSIVYDTVHHVGVNIVVKSDGSISGSQQYMVGSRNTQVIATGRIAARVLDADVEGMACARHYHLAKTS